MKEMKNTLGSMNGLRDCLLRWSRGSSPTDKEQKFVRFSFIHNPSYLYFIVETVWLCPYDFWSQKEGGNDVKRGTERLEL